MLSFFVRNNKEKLTTTNTLKYGTLSLFFSLFFFVVARNRLKINVQLKLYALNTIAMRLTDVVNCRLFIDKNAPFYQLQNGQMKKKNFHTQTSAHRKSYFD